MSYIGSFDKYRGQLYTDEVYQKLLQTKYPQRLSQDRHCGYTIINKRIYYI